MNIFFNETEKKLAEIWQQLLSVYPNMNSNFFASGGNSLLLIRLTICISEQIGMSVDVSGLLKNPVFSDMVMYVDSKKNEQLYKYNPKYRYEGYPVPLSFSQKNIWDGVKLSGFSANYNMPFCFHILSNLDLYKFKEIVLKMIKRHRIFSCNISIDEMGEPLIQSDIHDVTLQFSDLSMLSDDVKELRLIELEKVEFNKAINILNCPLAKIILVKISDEEYYFYLIIHHVIFDGVSCNLFLEELMNLYEYERLTQLNVDYLDYICWENSKEYRESLNQGVAYWEQKLRDYTPLKLPLLDESSSDRISNFISKQISIEDLQGLNELAKNNDTTLFVVFSLALQMVLERVKTSGEIIFGAYTSQRIHSEFIHSLGNFINPVILKCDFDINRSLSEGLIENHKNTVQDFSWQHVPFELIIKNMQVGKTSDRNPFFNISLVFNENVLKQEYQQGSLKIKLESKSKHGIDFDFDTDIEFVVYSNESGLFVGAAYINSKVGDELIHTILDSLSYLLSMFSTVNSDIALSEIPICDVKLLSN